MASLATNTTQSGAGFLSFNSMPPRLHIAGDDPEFDPVIIQRWKEEGFDVSYHALDPNDPKGFLATLNRLPDDLELGEAYALIAYGTAAAHTLTLHIKPQPHLCALVAYYPEQIAHVNASYPSSLQVLVHIAGSQGFSPSFRSYRYAGTKPGFAEYDLDEFDKVAASLSWSRTLAAVRKGFKKDVDLEGPLEKRMMAQFLRRDAKATVSTMSADAAVTNVPTATGGIGQTEPDEYYRDVFIRGIPENLNMRLVSRTIGTDRVVDEVFLSFRHTQVMPWILPDVPSTNKKVEIMIVNSVCIRGGRIVQERCYWDQASVLVQIGLLDPKLVPKGVRDLDRLPVIGAEGARKVLDEERVPTNTLISSWGPKADHE